MNTRQLTKQVQDFIKLYTDKDYPEEHLTPNELAALLSVVSGFLAFDAADDDPHVIIRFTCDNEYAGATKDLPSALALIASWVNPMNPDPGALLVSADKATVTMLASAGNDAVSWTLS